MIYVDDMFMPARVGSINGKWCHMFSDSLDPTELHELAWIIGMKRSWFQHTDDKPWKDHYDVTMSRRRMAVDAGAISITCAQAVEIWHQKRAAARVQSS